MMQLATLVGEIATGEAEEPLAVPLTARQERAAKGGRARAKSLSHAKRVAIARKAGAAPRRRG
jgi:hypothetical protein